MSNTLQNTVDWSRTFIDYVPLNVGANNEPAVSNANVIVNMLLGPPLCWPWNRKEQTFSTTVGQQDYLETWTDVGFIEKVSLTDPNNNSYEIKDVYNNAALSLSSKQARPNACALLISIPGTSAKFRFMPVPDQIYTVTVTYQLAPVALTSLSSTWSGIPDSYSDIYNPLFLAEALSVADDPRSQFYRVRGVSALLGKAEGLSDLQKAQILAQWLARDRQGARANLTEQQEVQARGQ